MLAEQVKLSSDSVVAGPALLGEQMCPQIFGDLSEKADQERGLPISVPTPCLSNLPCRNSAQHIPSLCRA